MSLRYIRKISESWSEAEPSASAVPLRSTTDATKKGQNVIMNKDMRYWLKGAVVGIRILIIVLIVWLIIFKWGDNQALKSEYVTNHLRIGMTVREAEMGLAMSEGDIASVMEKNDEGHFYADVSDSGPIGVLFVPQSQITLIFNHDKRLIGCSEEVHWRIDEYYIPVNIPK